MVNKGVLMFTWAFLFFVKYKIFIVISWFIIVYVKISENAPLNMF